MRFSKNRSNDLQSQTVPFRAASANLSAGKHDCCRSGIFNRPCDAYRRRACVDTAAAASTWKRRDCTKQSIRSSESVLAHGDPKRLSASNNPPRPTRVPRNHAIGCHPK
jgi:hypothetical protein